MRFTFSRAAFALIGIPVIAVADPFNSKPGDLTSPPDIVAEPPAPMSAAPPAEPSQFLSDESLIRELHWFNSAEIRKADLAESLATSEKVKAFARTLAKDHRNAELLVGHQADLLRIELEAALPAEKQMEVDQLVASDGSFDHQYLESVMAQNEAAILHLDLGEKTEPGVRRLNDTLLPMFKRHVSEAKRLQGNVARAE